MEAKQTPNAAAPTTFNPPSAPPSSPPSPSQKTSLEAARVAAEIQAAAVVAFQNPRNINECFNEIMAACKRKSLAEDALYAYKRGGTTVTGTSVKLARAIKQAWGNMDSGFAEVERGDGWSRIYVFANDVQKNVRAHREIIVKHERKSGQSYVPLFDPRDIQEMNANMASRAERVCLEHVIPAYVFEEAQAACEKTLSGDGSEPLVDRIRRMTLAFKEVGVSQEMIELRLGHKIEATIVAELVGLHKIFTSIRDQASKREDWFEFGPKEVPPSAQAENLKERLMGVKAAPTGAILEG